MNESQRIIELEAALRKAQNELLEAKKRELEYKKEIAALKGIPYEESKEEAIGLITPNNEDKKKLI
jgi:ATPase subunit of ABC transporter with duplicated ATPase domains